MLDYEVIVIGAGVAGIYQIKRLVDLGIEATVLEAAGGLGGTWYSNRYPGARFDSESYTYGYSFSRELLDEWHWKERFSGRSACADSPGRRRAPYSSTADRSNCRRGDRSCCATRPQPQFAFAPESR